MSLYRIRNIIIAAVVIIAAFILQGTVLSRLPVLGCSPNLVLIITFVYGYCEGSIPGMAAGFFCGLLTDIFFADVLGFNALVLVLIGFISGIWKTFFYSDDFYIPMAALTCSSLLYCLINFIFRFVLRARFDFGYYIIHIILPEFLLTFIAGVILYKPLSALTERLKI